MQGQPTERRFAGSDITLSYFEWGDPGAPVVLLVHATGFHARCWDEVVRALPDGYRVLAVDLRGHGRSERRGPYNQWNRFGADVQELVEAQGLRDAIAVGHSMGGHCVTQVAAALPGAFSRLLLVDPVILAPDLYHADRNVGIATAEDHPVARRRNEWASWQEMVERFSDRAPFSLWQPAVLEDYCRYGLLPRTHGEGFELACPPLVEASIYMGNTDTDIYHLIPQVEAPVVVLRARGREPGDANVMDFSKSPTWQGVAERFPQGRDVYLPELSHFIPMQDPALVARFVVDANAQA